ncbi:MAG: electron transfer flavoprotein subunit beta/FixA family protein [Candidatus Heimdallarchaeaceae archaeon]
MNIVVFIRQILDPQVNLEGIDYFDESKINVDDLIINPIDKNAIEGALKFKDSDGATVTAVCVGDMKPEKAVREAIAMGCNSGIVVNSKEIFSHDPVTMAKVYQKILEKIGEYDLVMIGGQVMPTSSYAEAPMLAELLDIPSVLYVEKLEKKDNAFIVSRVLEGGKEIVQVPLGQSLFSISDSEYFIPRYTSMRGIMMSKRAQIPTWTLEDLGLSASDIGKDSSDLEVVSLENIVIEKESFIISEGEPEEMVDKLLEKMKEDGIKLGGA